MIDVQSFCEYLKLNDINFFTGVPDSLIKEFCSYLENNFKKENNIIAANEGSAISIAAGYHLATNEIPLVYLQNSGLGNCINPLTSLTNKEVYSIPMLLMIGWRGEPGVADEPQHLKPGLEMINQLNLLSISYYILDKSSDHKMIINNAIKKANENKSPVAIIVKKNSFKKNSSVKAINKEYKLSRSDAIKIIIDNINDNDVVISTTGKASRELYFFRNKYDNHERDFLTVGSMGHVSSISAGLALGCKNKNIICIDGDGSALMHMGSMAINGTLDLKNYKYFLLNNGSHDSVGGQSTVGFQIDFCQIAKACNFKSVNKCIDAESLKDTINNSLDYKGSSMIEVMINSDNNIIDLPRPKQSPIENKNSFMEFISKE